MAAIISLGVHRPVGLQHLIDNGDLPESPESNQYQWHTYVNNSDNGCIEEEVLYTKRCVIWSQSNAVRAIYRFDLEDEDIEQAFLTGFPASRGSHQHDSKPTAGGNREAKIVVADSEQVQSSTVKDHESRALTVLLKSKLHIYFLHGSHHVVNLPFAVCKAFPAVHGLLLYRSRTSLTPLPQTPLVPAAPHNSFFSSQLSLRTSHLQSPTLQKSLGRSAPRIGPVNADESKLDELWQNMLGTSTQLQPADEAMLFTLTDPFSEPIPVTEVQRSPSLRLSGRHRKAADVEFDTLDPSEHIVYISPSDELQSGDESKHDRHGPLVLIATVNADRGTLTVWHGWHVHSKSLSELMQKRSEAKAETIRRRSSFLSGSVGTGATTPAVRNRDNLRESFVSMSQITTNTARKVTGQTDEATMASQLDPDFVIEGTQQSTKEVSRRISSLVSRGEAVVPNSISASFAAGSYRRGASFGGPIERRSFGQRRSRGSTPGSVLSRSFGIDEDYMMDFENESELDLDETIADTVRIIRATHVAAGAETLLGTLEGGWRRDLVFQRLHVFNLPPGSYEDDRHAEIKVLTVAQSYSCTKSESALLVIYLHDKCSKTLFSLSLHVKQQPLRPEQRDSAHTAVPVVRSHNTETAIDDILKLTDNQTHAVLLGGLGGLGGLGIRYPACAITCSVPTLSGYRLQHPFTTMNGSTTSSPDAGKNRTVAVPQGTAGLSHASIAGRFDETFSDGISHRQALRLRPSDPALDDILRICEIVLPVELACTIRPAWLNMYQTLLSRPSLLVGTVYNAEIIAVAATVLAQVLGLLDQRSKASLRLARVAASKQQYERAVLNLRQHDRAAKIDMKPAWSILQTIRPKTNTTRTLDQALPIAVALADDISPTRAQHDLAQEALLATKLMLGLHILLEERKLTVCTSVQRASILAAIIAQIAQWLNLDAWMARPGSYYDLGGASGEHWSFVKSNAYKHVNMDIMETPIGVFEWLEHSVLYKSAEQYPTLYQISQLGVHPAFPSSFLELTSRWTPRTTMLSKLLNTTEAFTTPPQAMVEAMALHGLTSDILESLPEGIAAPLQEAVAQCERDPPGSWNADLLRLVGRDDLITSQKGSASSNISVLAPVITTMHDVHMASVATELPTSITKTREADRNAISQLIFSEDRRLVDAAGLLHFNTVQVAECLKQPDWTDAYYFEQQKRVMQYVTTRMIALPIGDGILHYNSQSPLMTERYHLPGFSSSCVMQPIGHTVTTDRSGLTEEKVNWAYFHAGVSAGLRISKHATGIDTSWLVFNKPNELTNRHAGLLLALGLNGHLKHLAKWLSFKYLTPKHTMTSLGLLLGLAASHLGTMDGLITRMLSVHITCMLPQGAAELNVSPLTQTAGLLGIGLLYYNTQHRRMTETMLQEIESTGVDDPDCGPDALRDESYRLAAGFALGLINLGRGKDLRGLHGVQLRERLLRVAVGPRPVQAVHVLDKATAGATMATALIYMKSGDAAIARQIDVPDTETQFEHVRPDMLMLRTLAKHVILWNLINIDHGEEEKAARWIEANLPKCCKAKWIEANSMKASLNSSDLPFYYIVTGLALAVSLKYAGSGHTGARNEILGTLDLLWAVQRKRVEGQHFYDTKLARAAIRRCIDVLALAAATVMSGTGDIQAFRYLRRLHGRTDAETPYGSHLASHMGIGILFMGGGTCILGTSDLAIASLMCSLYPLFPIGVQDNKVHLQAFRHLWVFAVEPRCLIVEDVDTGRPIQMPVSLTLQDGSTQTMQSPCLLPDLNTIARLTTTDASYWRIALDFASNEEHLRNFKADQRISVRRCPASEAHESTFWATFSALTTDIEKRQFETGINGWMFSFAALESLDRGDIELVSPPDERNSSRMQGKATRVDDRLTLRGDVQSDVRDRLLNLRVLLAWARRLSSEGHGNTRWLGRQPLAKIECEIEERQRAG